MGLDTAVVYQSTTNDVNLETVLHANHFQVGVVLDLDCPFSENILNEFSNQLQFNDSYYWIVLSKLTAIPVDYLELLRFTIETELTFAVRDDDTYKLYDIYNPSYRHGCNVVMTDKGQWTPKYGLNDILTQYKYVRRDLQGVTLNLSVTFVMPVKTDAITYLSSTEHKELDLMQKSHYHLVLFLQHMYKFRFDVYRSPLWGILVNGSYNGILGDIIGNTGVDMSLSPFDFVADRTSLLEHTVPTWYADFTFTFLHPKTSTLRNNFVKPFTNDLWWAISLMGVIYWALLWLSLMLEQRHQSGKRDVNEGVVETGLTTVAALSQQGLSGSPNCFSGRITFLSLFLWALLLYQFYSASIVRSLLTTERRWIQTLKNLSDSDLEVGAVDTSYFRNYFKTTTDPVIIELYNRKMNSSMEERPNAYLTTLGWKKMQQGGYAFLMETGSTYRMIAETFTEDQICAVHEIRLQKRTKGSPILPKGSPFQKMMTYGLTKIIQSGLLAHLQKEWRGSLPQCPESYSSKPTPMGMIEFTPALFLLSIGVGVAMATLFMEYLHFYLGSKSNPATEESPQ